jgi:hypothetical protein
VRAAPRCRLVLWLPAWATSESVNVCLITTCPPCSTVIVAVVNDRSVMSSVQLGFGHSGAPAIGVGGGFVVTSNGVLPF